MCVKFYAVKTDMGFVTIPYSFWEHFKLLLVSLGNLLLFLADFCVIFLMALQTSLAIYVFLDVHFFVV